MPRLGYRYLKHGSGAAVRWPSVAAGGVPPQLPVEGENSSSLHAARVRTFDSLSLRHRPEACRAAGQLAYLTPHCGHYLPVLTTACCCVRPARNGVIPSAMMSAETFKWVLDDHPSVGCEYSLSLSPIERTPQGLKTIVPRVKR